MQESLKRAWAALKVRHAVILILAILVIIYGSLVLMDVVQTESRVTKLVSAARPDGDTLVLSRDAVFENKVLEFLKVDKLCPITTEQAETLKVSYTAELKEYYIAQQAKTVFVLYFEGPKTNMAQIEKAVGEIDNDNCEVVHGKKVIALLATLQ
jgi:hypothetical protein